VNLKPVRVEPEADEELTAAVSWYEARRPGLGSALWVFYRHHPELLPPLEKSDQLLPWFIAQQVPPGLAGLPHVCYLHETQLLYPDDPRGAVGHVVHDLRARAQAEADRDDARALAERFAWPFHEREISIGGGNAENVARRLRYEALAQMAREQGLAFVASAHHADDQFESVLMALLRGAGTAGLRGVAPSRPLSADVTLIRPMLGVTREEAEEVCSLAGVAWREDETNLDTTRLRAALRHGPMEQLRRLRPKGAVRAARSAEILREAHALVVRAALDLDPDADAWPRRQLRGEPAIVVGELLRRAARRRLAGRRADALTSALVDQAAGAIRSPSTDPKSLDWPGNLRLIVDARSVRFEQSPKTQKARRGSPSLPSGEGGES